MQLDSFLFYEHYKLNSHVSLCFKFFHCINTVATPENVTDLLRPIVSSSQLEQFVIPFDLRYSTKNPGGAGESTHIQQYSECLVPF